MTATAPKEMKHIGDTRGCANHDHDLVHELSKRLDALWRYDQYIANADGKQALQDFWREVKRQDVGNVQRLKDLISTEVKDDCF